MKTADTIKWQQGCDGRRLPNGCVDAVKSLCPQVEAEVM